VLSFIDGIRFHMPVCFKKNSSGPVSKVSKLDEKQRQQQMQTAIHEIAENVSGLVRQMVPTSPSARVRLKDGDNGQGNCLSQTDNETILNKTRREMTETFQRNMDDWGWADYGAAVVHAHTGYALQVLTTKVGNCAEMAMLAAILLNATLKEGLMQRGFSADEVARADIGITIWELTEPGQVNSDHTVCLLNYRAGEECQLFVDPWMNGVVYDPKDADRYYEKHVNNVKQPLVSVRAHQDKTLAAADERCTSVILRHIEKQYGIDMQYPLREWNTGLYQ
jgi:hypothetical protein